jgi:hypothetical protein
MAQKDARLGDQDQARRRGGTSEGLGASREGGRGRGPDREGLGPVRQRRKGSAGGPRRPSGRGKASAQDNVERPRADEASTSTEGREQPPVEPEATRPEAEAAAEAPAQAEDQPQPESTGDESAEKSDG